MTERMSTELRALIGTKTLWVIDEAQRVRNIGLTLNLLVDNFPNISERLKANTNQRRNVNSYFWRTYDRYELDLVEEEGGRLVGYERKWREKRWQPPGLFTQTYPESTVHLVHRENYLDFLT